MSFRLDGQVALVIGGTSGIGAAIANGFREAGAHALVVGRTPAKLPERDSYLADVTRLDELQRLVAKVLADHGRIDSLVNCQGTTTLKPAEEFTAEDYDGIMATNLRSVFFACTAVGRHMLERGSGSIVNIGSLASITALGRGHIAYSMAMGAVIQMTRELSTEWAGRGVRVNAILPAQVLNPSLEKRISADATLKEKFLSGIPSGRLGQPDDIKGLAVFLASDASSWITGALIPMDGGNLAANAGATIGVSPGQ